ncbi:MAG TPA: alpha/beta fold hydrolase [Sporichthya sp.]|nr:alpha/beta fold hydrolase [Sporichthya sp.]
MTRTIIAAGLALTLLGGAAPAASARPAGPTIAWGHCEDEILKARKAQCGFLAVPLDYADPGGAKIRIAVSRSKAKGPARERRGILLSNPGGPGASGLVPTNPIFGYDAVGFDPRGIGASRPKLRCTPPAPFRGLAPSYAPPGSPNSAVSAGEKKWLKQSRELARNCAKSGPILAHMTTIEVARDMDAIRAALGEEKLSYFGNSYGTYLGQVYATLFPQRVDRMLLDSVVSPKGIWYDFQLEQAVGAEKGVDRFWAWIARRHARFGLGTSAAAARRWALRERGALTRHPVGGIGPREWSDVLELAGSDFLRKRVAVALGAWKSGDRRRMQDLVTEFELGGRAALPVTAYLPVTCTDGAWPRDYATVRRDAFALAERAPVMGWSATVYNLPCLYWPAPQRTPATIAGMGLPPLLLLNSEFDGSTPLSGALTARDTLPSASLVLLAKSSRHGVLNSVSACVLDLVRRYFDDGAVPPRKGSRGPDVSCRE